MEGDCRVDRRCFHQIFSTFANVSERNVYDCERCQSDGRNSECKWFYPISLVEFTVSKHELMRNANLYVSQPEKQGIR